MVRMIVLAWMLLLLPGISAAQIAPDEQQTPIHSPWTKTCHQLNDGAQVCYTTTMLRKPCQQIGAASLVSKDGEPNILRVIVAWRAWRGSRTQITVDNGPSRTEPIVTCVGDVGCMSNYMADAELITRLKQGSALVVEELGGNKEIRFTLPLAGFAEAFDGPGFDPKVVEVPVEELRRQLADRPRVRCQFTPLTPPPRP